MKTTIRYEFIRPSTCSICPDEAEEYEMRTIINMCDQLAKGEEPGGMINASRRE